MEDKEILKFIYNRMVFIYKENMMSDHMIRFAEIIENSVSKEKKK